MVALQFLATHVYTHMSYQYISSCVYACMRVCLHACMLACVYACMHVCLQAYIPINLHITYTNAYGSVVNNYMCLDENSEIIYLAKRQFVIRVARVHPTCSLISTQDGHCRIKPPMREAAGSLEPSPAAITRSQTRGIQQTSSPWPKALQALKLQPLKPQAANPTSTSQSKRC